MNATMLPDRNNSVHTYNEELAVAMEARIRVRYSSTFSTLGTALSDTV